MLGETSLDDFGVGIFVPKDFAVTRRQAKSRTSVVRPQPKTIEMQTKAVFVFFSNLSRFGFCHSQSMEPLLKLAESVQVASSGWIDFGPSTVHWRMADASRQSWLREERLSASIMRASHVFFVRTKSGLSQLEPTEWSCSDWEPRCNNHRFESQIRRDSCAHVLWWRNYLVGS